MTDFKKLGPWVHAPHRGGSKAEGMRKLGGSTGKKVSSPLGRKYGGSFAEALAEAKKLILIHHSGGRTAEAQRKLSGS